MSRESLMNVLIGPHVSEKSARISEGANQFVFRVRRDATKPDIKAAVELMFEVKVADVNVVNVGAVKQDRNATSRSASEPGMVPSGSIDGSLSRG